MSNLAIQVTNLSKKYRLGRSTHPIQSGKALLHKVTTPFRSLKSSVQVPGEAEILWALKDVSFEVPQGKAIGIIGRNGAGKSTLLKILSRITEPTSGRAVLNGRVGSLLEVGTGFHPELTGRENIYLNGAILGMRKTEIDRKFDEIIAFAEIEKFLDTPVKRYSSGMYVRLAFAVAAHLEPEILLIDEVLAVGDAEFQKKCLGKMELVSQEGRTVLFVSHNMMAILSLCSQSLWLKNGTVQAIGDTATVVDSYLHGVYEKSEKQYTTRERYEGRNVNLLEANLIFTGEQPSNGQELIFEAKIELIRKMQFSAHLIVHRDVELVMVASDFHAPLASEELSPGTLVLRFRIPPYLLNPGYHALDLLISDFNGNHEQFLKVQNVIHFELIDDGYRRGNRYYLGWGGAISPILNISIERVSE